MAMAGQDRDLRQRDADGTPCGAAAMARTEQTFPRDMRGEVVRLEKMAPQAAICMGLAIRKVDDK